ncbi:hypothetical protein CBA19CS11_32370 [Caballeronia novacaledonica]|uniref:hypothetical protein n=1 Tax=Caballeronia novacaledonica TaxID=1544861 RepID=UPI001EE16759|nr:hypothetical protein [Caballeronia novacaledonica]GJH13634.1 hypothetical protein CBA19CS11_32370 [Caballeronia novacaledonica]
MKLLHGGLTLRQGLARSGFRMAHGYFNKIDYRNGAIYGAGQAEGLNQTVVFGTAELVGKGTLSNRASEGKHNVVGGKKRINLAHYG